MVRPVGEKRNEGLVLGLLLPVLDCVFQVSHPLLKFIATDLRFQCFHSVNQDLKGTDELTVICLNPLQPFQHFCICAPGGDAAGCCTCLSRRWNRHLFQHCPVGFQVELCKLLQHLGVFLSLLTAQCLECFQGVRSKVGIEGTWSCWRHC